MSKQKDSLTHEICIRVLEYLGVLPISNFGKLGITLEEFQIPSKHWISLQYSDEEMVDHPIYSVSSTIDDLNFNILLVDLSLSVEHIEFYLLFKFGEFKTYYLYFKENNEEKYSNFFINKEDKTWITLDLQAKAMVLVGFDTLFSSGIQWNFIEENKGLLDLAISLIKNDLE